MVDSELVGIGGVVAAGLADVPVVPEAGGGGGRRRPNSGAEAREGGGAVALVSGLALAGPEGRFDGLAGESRRAGAGLLVAPVGTREGRSLVCDEAVEVVAREALVGDQRVAGERQPLERLLGRLALGGVGGGRLEADRGAVAGADELEPQAPEVARVGAAVAVAGETGEVAAPAGRARLAVWHGRRVERPDPVAAGRRAEGQVADRAGALRHQPPPAVAVARPLGQLNSCPSR
jgi:hypothetical protein